MSSPYRIFGAEMSPYSVKVRSYARYKGLTHTWVNRGFAWRQKPKKSHAKSLDALRAKYNAVNDRGVLDAILDKAPVRQGLIA